MLSVLGNITLAVLYGWLCIAIPQRRWLLVPVVGAWLGLYVGHIVVTLIAGEIAFQLATSESQRDAIVGSDGAKLVFSALITGPLYSVLIGGIGTGLFSVRLWFADVKRTEVAAPKFENESRNPYEPPRVVVK